MSIEQALPPFKYWTNKVHKCKLEKLEDKGQKRNIVLEINRIGEKTVYI